MWTNWVTGGRGGGGGAEQSFTDQVHLTAGVVFVELEAVSFNAMCENRLVPRQSQLR